MDLKRLAVVMLFISVRQTVDTLAKGGCTVNLCTIDLSKAFDKVYHHGLFIKLMKRKIPVKLLKPISYHDRKFIVYLIFYA